MAQGIKINYDKDELYKLYWVKGLNGMEIAKKLGYGWHSIYKAFKKFNIPLRPRGIAMKMVCAKTGHNKYERNPRWKGGRMKHHGYILINVMPDDPFASMAHKSKSNYILEHRYVMAKHLGRVLTKTETVHHKNGIKHDNRINNLELVSFKNHHLVTQFCKNCPIRKELKQLKEACDKMEE